MANSLWPWTIDHGLWSLHRQYKPISGQGGMLFIANTMVHGPWSMDFPPTIHTNQGSVRVTIVSLLTFDF